MADTFDFDALLDKSIDDLADLPEFKVPDTGMYKLTVQASTKIINDKPAVQVDVTVREVVELVDTTIPEADRAKNGDKFNLLFILKNDKGEDMEISWGRLKEFSQPFQTHFNEGHLGKLLSGPLAQPVDITAKIVKKARKDDKEKFDARISDISID